MVAGACLVSLATSSTVRSASIDPCMAPLSQSRLRCARDYLFSRNKLRTTTISVRPLGTALEKKGSVPWRRWYLPMKFAIEVDDPRYPLALLEVRSFPEPRLIGVKLSARTFLSDEMVGPL